MIRMNKRNGTSKLINLIGVVYFLTIGFVSAFSLHSWVPFTMFMGLLIFGTNIYILIRKGKFCITNKINIFGFYIFFIILIVSFINQVLIYGFQVSGLTHTLSYLAVICVYYFGIQFYLINTRFPLNKIYKYISQGVIFVAVFSIVEFVAKNFIGINFDTLIPRKFVKEFVATYPVGGIRFFRARGTTGESGHLALFLLMFTPFVYYYYGTIMKKKGKTVVFLSVIFFAVLMTFSAMGLFEIVISAFIIISIYFLKGMKRGFKSSNILSLFFVSFLIVIIILLIMGDIINIQYLDGIISKITFSRQSISNEGSRLGRWYNSFLLIKKSPLIGQGAGITSILFETGSTSLYLELLVAVGVCGFTVFMFNILHNFILATKLKGTIKYIFLVSYTIILSHYFIISNYWFPWLWLLLILTQIQYFEQNS